MRPLLVVAHDEVIEAGLLLQDIGRLRGFFLQREMHPLVPPVLFRVARLNTLELNAQAEPPHGQFAQPPLHTANPCVIY
jgi:hypothetical protein